MSATRTPDLPEDFGNPWMSNLEEIQLPPRIPFTPETIGWYLLAGGLVLLLIWLVWRIRKRWRANAYRRAALRELEEIDSPRAVPELLKRVALVAYPRAEVAQLTGEAWLGFLDGSLGTSDFTRGAGRLLPDLAYDPSAADRWSDRQRRDLLALCRRWVRKHRSAAPPAPVPTGVGTGRFRQGTMGAEQG